MDNVLQLPLAIPANEFAAVQGEAGLNVAGRVGDALCVVVYGTPQPAGSKSSFAIQAGPRGQKHYTGKVGMRDGRTPESAQRHKSWRAQVQETAAEVMHGKPVITGPVMLLATFSLPRPKVHYLTHGDLSAEGRRTPWPSGKPDATKLLRSIEDSLQDAGVLANDSQIVRQHIAKEWARPNGDALDILSRPGVVIRIRALS